MFKICSWGKGLPSQARIVILIQIALQAIPIFYMRCFLLLKTFMHELDMLMARFLWSGLGERICMLMARFL